MKIWVDDIRTPPDDSWIWSKTSSDAIRWLTNSKIVKWRPGWGVIEVMSLDHDLGGDDTTRPVVRWMMEHDFWPREVYVHSANPTGVEWLEEMISHYGPLSNGRCAKCGGFLLRGSHITNDRNPCYGVDS